MTQILDIVKQLSPLLLELQEYAHLLKIKDTHTHNLHHLPYQVVNAQQQGLDAAGGVGVSGCADGQEAPQELWQEL